MAVERESVGFGLLGSLEAQRNGELLPLGGAKQRALLARLLVDARRVVSTDTLVDDLWGEHPPEGALHTVQVFVSRLRKILGADVLVTRAPGYLADVRPEQIDSEQFRALLAEGELELSAGRVQEAVALYEQALALWRGEPLADFAYEAWASEHSGRLQELRLTGKERWMEAQLALSGHADVVGELEQLVAAHPQRERFRAQLMLALYRSGRQAEALEVYTEVRETLVEQLGIDPSPELQTLYRQILNQDASLAAPMQQPSASHRTNLPVPATAFVGRERELGEVVGLLLRDDVRLVTLTGPGGTGKTRLALKAVAEVVERFPDGVFWVPLAALKDADLVVGAVGDAVDAKDDVAVHIGERRLLLLLDNFEQLIGAASLVAELLDRCPRLVVLVTSRELFRVAREHTYAVSELSARDSVELFTARARAVQGQIGSSADVDELCRRLEYLPLAIELAAARTTHLGSRQLLERLDRRLDVLRGGRDADPRQQTLRATIEWSYDSLAEDEAALFARLSVFVGGCTLEAAEEVCDVGIDALGSLVDKSLVRRSGDRFWMLEMIHQFAAERLAEGADGIAVRDRHAAHFVSLARRAEPELIGPEQRAWLHRLRDELPNIRAAILLLEEGGRFDDACEILASLREFWDMDARFAEPRVLAERLLERGELAPRTRGRALAVLGMVLLRQGDLHGVLRVAAEAADQLERAGDVAAAAHARAGLGFALLLLDRVPEGLALSQTAANDAKRAGDRWTEAFATNILACNTWVAGERNRAYELAAHARALFGALGDTRNDAVVLHNLAEFALADGRLEHAGDLLDEAFAVGAELEDRDFLAATQLLRARYELLAGDAGAARDTLVGALSLAREVGDRLALGECLRFVAGIAADNQDERRAISLWAVSAELVGDIAGVPGIKFVDEQYLVPLRDLLPTAEYDRAWSYGESLTLDGAIDVANAALGTSATVREAASRD